MGESPKKVTAPAIVARKGVERIAMITAYDAPSAAIASQAGIDIILVGDSVANAALGFDSTLLVDVDVMIHHTAAVARAKPHSLVLGDLPWMSYHISTEDAVRNASRLIREGGAEAVKLEGGANRIPVIEAIVAAEIPVMGHLGLTPQSVNAMGGYKVQGRGVADARELIADAHALTRAGVFAMVLEGVPETVAQIITKEVDVPTIGIGAGVHCDGQVLVWHDALGLHDGHYAKFVRKYADLRQISIDALTEYVSDVRTEAFPGEAETYHMSEEAATALSEEEPRELSWPLSW